MKDRILNDFSLQTTDFSIVENFPDEAFVNEHFGMIRNSRPYMNHFVSPGQLYHFSEGRIDWVTAGSADIELTLDEYHIEKGDIMLLAPETIMELKSCSTDYTLMGVIYKDMIPLGNNLVVRADEAGWRETVRLADILWDIARQKPFRLTTVNYLLSAIISDIHDINRAQQEKKPDAAKTRREQVFARFKKLVNENCCHHRNVPFYAGELALTPHYLSSLISAVSGRSVMHWINRATLIQAKVLLKDRDMLVGEVADRLNFPSQSGFGTFFRRETGMTPSEYQRNS